MTEVRREPCSACPYRRDVASGIWAHEEYEKLRDYDAPTGYQPMGAFACHATPDHFCHGWAVVHTSRGSEHDLLALRLHGDPEIPAPAVPLFGSGNEAADHGQADVEAPSPAAVETAAKLLRKHPRLRP
jgi:hypothetical protein